MLCLCLAKMPRGPGKKENYNFDYSRFKSCDEEEVEIQRKPESAAEADPGDMFRQLPGELQEAFRLMQISKETGDEKAMARANELALKAVEKGGPEMKKNFQQEVMRQTAKNPEAKMAMEEMMNSSAPSPAESRGDQLDDLSDRISMMQQEMQASAACAQKNADALQQQQEALENIENPEDFAKFLAQQGLSPDDLQRLMSGDEAFMKQTFDKAISNVEPPEFKKSVEKADAVMNVVDTIHKQLNSDEPDLVAPPMPSRPAESKREDAPVRAPPRTKSAPEPKIPEHRVQYEKDESGRLQSVQLRCELPGVNGMADIELDVSERYLRLRTLTPAYVVNVGPFPALVEGGAARAKFSKKKQELTLTVPAQT